MATEKTNIPVPEEHVGEAEDVKNVTESGGRTAVAEAPAVPATAEEESASVKHEGPDGADENETVNFADEDAALDAAQPELDMGEATDEERAQEEHADAETARNLEDISRLDKHRLVELFAEYRRRRAEYLANIEKEKEENLRTKLQIIEELKELVNGNETMNSTFNAFRELQQRWRETGIVPQANVKELWETYNLHVENFYNYIKINKELRDLDLKRNYEAKVQLCEAAEALMLEPSIVTAFRKLQDLHDQWRETGPVANEYKEALWERFKEASTRINKQHQEYFEKLKEEQRHNLELKTELCVKVEELSSEILTTRKEWNKASERLIEIQKVWKTIGFAPQKDNARIYERFRNACDKFFEQKREFYEQLKTEMDTNLQLKTEICEQAESLQESEQWKKTTDELIALQKRWKEIGPVPRRYSDAVWKRFRAACDRFFERKSAHFSGVDAQHEENLQAKLALLTEMEAADISEGGFEMIKEFQRRWNEIGFVPLRQKDEVQQRYRAVVDGMFATLRGGERERSMDRFRVKVSDMKGSGDKRLRFERDRLYNKVKQLESDIATLENNIGFFSRSKNAEAMIREVEAKITKAKQEMADTIEKIKLIDSQQEQGDK
ncbi:MAG: DNA primase [Alistipes sp. 56_11]|nr:MAG: DNA primase [Alistipes sp. 56_11]